MLWAEPAQVVRGPGLGGGLSAVVSVQNLVTFFICCLSSWLRTGECGYGRLFRRAEVLGRMEQAGCQ